MTRYTIIGGKYVDLDEEGAPAYGTRRKEHRQPKATAREGVAKRSFEANADVQRWLKETQEQEGAKEPFAPEALVGRRDGDWVLSSLTHFYEQDLIADVLREVKSGKEATVFCCAGGPAHPEALFAAKIYRPRMFRSLSNDAQYREGRVVRNESGKQVRLTGKGVPSRNSAKGRAFQIASWIGYEYATQELAYALGVRTPRPVAQSGNGLLMAYLGDEHEVAPRLCEIEVGRGEAQDLLDGLLEDISLLLGGHRIHGDLSVYNILAWEGEPYIIDFAQAVDPRQGDDARALLARDVQRVTAALAPFGARADARAVADRLWWEYLQG
ncbi:MAG TPA: RIO1 family regulatory kinase/ATPase [Chloroflexaceae bacterium]|nr:RIO1 family regulatory kinase/ATPase [Chloroflexaceae bacterium]